MKIRLLGFFIFSSFFAFLSLLSLKQEFFFLFLKYQVVQQTTYSVPDFSSQTQNPQMLALPFSNGNYFKASFSFRPNGFSGYPNIFQTANLDSGLRVELPGPDALLLSQVNSNVDVGSVLTGFYLLKGLAPGSWYHVSLEGISGHYLHARLKGQNGFFVLYPDFQINDLKLGIGYDTLRKFNGEIKDFNATVAQTKSGRLATCAYYGLEAFLFCFSLLGFLWLRQTAVGKVEKSKSFVIHRYDPILTFRTVSCFSIFLGHAVGVFHPVHLEAALKIGLPIWIFVSSSHAGLWMLFTLTGFLIGKGFFSHRYEASYKGILNFWRSRVLRLMPLYYFALILVSLVFYHKLFALKRLYMFIHMATFTYNGLLSMNPIGALWSITTLVYFYLLAPFVFLACGYFILKFPKSIGGILVAVLMVAGVVYRTQIWHNFGYVGWLYYVHPSIFGNLDLFLIGFFSSAICLHLQKKVLLKNGILFGLIGLLVIYLSASYAESQGVFLHEEKWISLLSNVFPTIICGLSILTLFAFELSRPVEQGSIKSLRYIVQATQKVGLLTYGIYIWHGPILDQLHRFFIDTPSFRNTIYFSSLSFVLSVFIAYVTYYWVELPFARKKRGRLEESFIQAKIESRSE